MCGAGGLAEEVAGRVRGPTLAAFEAAVHTRFVAGGDARRCARDAAAAALQASATHLQILAAGAEARACPPRMAPPLLPACWLFPAGNATDCRGPWRLLQ